MSRTFENRYFKYANKCNEFVILFGGAGLEIIYPDLVGKLQKKLFNILYYSANVIGAPSDFIKPPKPTPYLYEHDLDNFLIDIMHPETANLLNKFFALGSQTTIPVHSFLYKNISSTRMRQRNASDNAFVHTLANLSGQKVIDYLYEKYGKEVIDKILSEKGIRIPATTTFDDKKISCDIHDVMTLDDITVCKDKDLYNVLGSCKHPAFVDGNVDISEEEKRNWEALIDLILSKIGDTRMTLIIGATTNVSYFGTANTYIEPTKFTLLINPNSSYGDFNSCFTTIRNAPSLVGLVVKCNIKFPLTHTKPNSTIVLNKLATLKNKLLIVNRMCGSCHRSFYYLVNEHSVEYINEPEQGYSLADTECILNCFKN